MPSKMTHVTDIFPSVSTAAPLLPLMKTSSALAYKLGEGPDTGQFEEYFLGTKYSTLIFTQTPGIITILNLPFNSVFKLSIPINSKCISSAFIKGWWMVLDEDGNIHAMDIQKLEEDDEGTDVKKIKFEIGRGFEAQYEEVPGRRIKWKSIATDTAGKWVLISVREEFRDATQTPKDRLLIFQLIEDDQGSLDLRMSEVLDLEMDDEKGSLAVLTQRRGGHSRKRFHQTCERDSTADHVHQSRTPSAVHFDEDW